MKPTSTRAREIDATLQHPEVTKLCQRLADMRQHGRAIIRSTFPGRLRDQLLRQLSAEQRALHARIRELLGTSEARHGMIDGPHAPGCQRPAWNAATTFHW
jgi:hypothetical protein